MLLCGLALCVAGVLAPAAMAATQAPRLIDGAAHLVAAALCAREARGTRGTPRAVWLMFGAWLGIWGAATLAWGLLALGGWQAPATSALDLVWLASYVPLLAALGLLYRTLLPGLGRGGAIDALTLACGLGLIGWQLVLAPVASAAGVGLAAALAPSAYPILDLLALCMVGWLILRRGLRPGRLLALLGALVAQLIGEVAFLQGAALGHASAEWGAEGMWVISAGIFAAMAGAHRRGAWAHAERDPGPAPAWTQLMPLPVAASAGIVGLLNPGDVRLLAVAVLAQLLVVGRLVGAVSRAERLGRENARLSVTDPLTGAHNRRFLDATLADEVARAGRSGRALAVVALDLDRFKPVNDQLGHAAGDHLLVVCTRVIQACLRPSDRLCRLGGDEFVVVAPEADAADGLVLAARLLDAVRVAGEEHAPGIGVHASAGIASCPELPRDAGALLRSADRALYRAKRAGRGRALVAEAVAS